MENEISRAVSDICSLSLQLNALDPDSVNSSNRDAWEHGQAQQFEYSNERRNHRVQSIDTCDAKLTDLEQKCGRNVKVHEAVQKLTSSTLAQQSLSKEDQAVLAKFRQLSVSHPLTMAHFLDEMNQPAALTLVKDQAQSIQDKQKELKQRLDRLETTRQEIMRSVETQATKRCSDMTTELIKLHSKVQALSETYQSENRALVSDADLDSTLRQRHVQVALTVQRLKPEQTQTWAEKLYESDRQSLRTPASQGTLRDIERIHLAPTMRDIEFPSSLELVTFAAFCAAGEPLADQPAQLSHDVVPLSAIP